MRNIIWFINNNIKQAEMSKVVNQCHLPINIFQMYENTLMGKMQRFLNHFYKQMDIYKLYNTDAFYKIYVWCVVPDHRNKGKVLIYKLRGVGFRV